MLGTGGLTVEPLPCLPPLITVLYEALSDGVLRDWHFDPWICRWGTVPDALEASKV